MKIFVAGTRGIPEIPGGVEKHCQQLYPRITASGHEVRLARRRPYVSDGLQEWNGIELTDLFAPRTKKFEAIVHTFLAVLAARRWGADIMHIHAVGPSLMVPFAKLLGLRVVVTNHGPDYNRAKWGRSAKALLKLGEWLGSLFSDEVIVISKGIGEIVRKRASRESNLIYNGIPQPHFSESTDDVLAYGLRPKRYALALARFVPEKGLHDLVDAFKKTDTDWNLVLAGDADHEDKYSRALKAAAAEDPRIVLTGYITGERLEQVLTHAGLFVLPSYHEGLPIALLEALTYRLPCLVSDIQPNLEVELPEQCYFRCGDVDHLQGQLLKHLEGVLSEAEQQMIQSMIKQKYDWDRIAVKTMDVYHKATGTGGTEEIGYAGLSK